MKCIYCKKDTDCEALVEVIDTETKKIEIKNVPCHKKCFQKQTLNRDISNRLPSVDLSLGDLI